MSKSLGLVVVLGLLTACGAAPSGGEGDVEEGSAVQLNLSTIAASGTEYRLGPATFEIYRAWESPLLHSLEADGTQQKLHLALEAGRYRVDLKSGWTLSRVDGATLTPVAATLTSPASQEVDVARFTTVPLTFAFHLGEAGIDLGVSVNEGVPPGYDAQLVPLPGNGYQLEWASGWTSCCYSGLAEAQAAYPYLNIFAPAP